ncbi:hypothetical protein [Chlorogloeopsis sp. ULAP02]|uniref:hypothetical protein n=1 Tax=Chlorogloeopsis sp. ULAP02 TaxID=3107926 RepID=UPI003134D766
MKNSEYTRFLNLSFDDFRKMANDPSLSCYEKIGFPNSYREGKEQFIFEDIIAKTTLLNSENKVVLDIGPGCSELPIILVDICEKNNHKLIWVDSPEMLSILPDKNFIQKIPGYYPYCQELFNEYRKSVDVIIAYSVFHYIFVESNIWNFLDKSLELMTHGGEMLIGDIPNISKRKRFFSSPAGIKFHQEFTSTQEIPEVTFNKIEHHQIDDAVILSLIHRARNQGFDAYILPQRNDLPMANRREDILIKKP